MASAQNDFSKGSVVGNIMGMAIPMTAAQLINLLYNVVDRIYIGYIPEHATLSLTGLGVCLPVITAVMAFANLFGMGGAPLCSIERGRGNQKEAEAIMGNAFTLMVICGILLTILGIVFRRPLLYLFGASDSTYPYAESYMTIYLLGSVFVMMGLGMNAFINSQGFGRIGMQTVLLGAVANIILDPILIFGLFGLPRLEVAGAALATVIGQFIAAGLSLFFNLTRNHDIQFRFRGFRPDRGIIARIYSVGVPSIVMSSIGSVMVFGMNKILISFTTTATAVFGVYFKLQSFIFMPVFGLNNGMVPIVAYNYGAGRPDRIVQTIKLSVAAAVTIMLAGLLAFQLAPHILLDLFRSENDSGDLLTIGIPALRIISLSFLFAGYSIVCSSVFQALGHGVLSLLVSVVRQLVVLLPVAFLLSRASGLAAVWWAFPTAELFSLTLSTVFLRRVYLREIKFLASRSSRTQH